MKSGSRDKLLYRILLWVGLIASSWLLFQRSISVLTSPEVLKTDDYVEYWSAGRLNLLGGNPYDPAQLTPLQLATGRAEGVPVMMWNPPWTLAIAMPLSWLDYPVSRFLWLLLNLGIIFFVADWGWRVYGGAPGNRWVAWLVAFTFGPCLHVLKAGQIAPLLLLGVVGFLYFARQERWGVAGAMAALITIKPHLLYLFGLALLFWALEHRRWRLLLGFAAAIILAMGSAWAINPALVSQYLYALAHYPPAEWATSTFGAVLRIRFGIENFWLQFLPSVLGCLWFVFYWQRHRERWDWREQLPILVLVSVVTAAYGWTFDYPVFLLAIVQSAVWLLQGRWTWSKRGLLWAYIGLMLVSLFSSQSQLWYWWMASWLLLWYWLVRRIALHEGIEDSFSRGF